MKTVQHLRRDFGATDIIAERGEEAIQKNYVLNQWLWCRCCLRMCRNKTSN